MKCRSLFSLLTIFAILVSGCASNQPGATPPAPANIQAVMDFVKGKKLQTQKAGFYGSLTVNGVKEMNWIDTKKENNKITKDATAEALDLSLQFINDTAAIVFKKGQSFPATFFIDEVTGEQEDETPGIKLHISFIDPDFSFGNDLSKITYTYHVLGLDGKKIMLETPRSINRQKLITLMSE